MKTALEMLQDKIYCMECKNDIRAEGNQLICCICHSYYEKDASVWNLLKFTNTSQNKIETFWSALYHKLHDKHKNIDKNKLYELLDELTKLFLHEQQLIGTELKLEEIDNKDILEIGCGAGSDSCLLKRAGSNLISVDISPDRVRETERRLSLIDEGVGIAVQANAECLPFKSCSFDIVYSFGVLHHTSDTERAVSEIYRVLRPGGKAIIMLYAKDSFYYYVLWVKALITGKLWKKWAEGNWLGSVTECGPGERTSSNPFTRCYTRSEITFLFSNYKNVGIRKNAFQLYQIPQIGWRIENLLKKIGICGENNGEILNYGQPARLRLPFEKKLGESIGFFYYITALKS